MRLMVEQIIPQIVTQNQTEIFFREWGMRTKSPLQIELKPLKSTITFILKGLSATDFEPAFGQS